MAAEPDDTLVERARAQLGRVLKQKYRLEALLGVGGMAAVFAARHRNGNRVALKLLHPELMLNAEALRRFLQEGYAANKVEHPGTVRVLDDDSEGGEAFLVMELLEGETVDALAERSGGSIDPKRVLRIADEALDVLAAAHDQGIVHRDIKPENLFLTKAGTLKILDFGIARVRESTGGVTVTKTGSPFGSPAFMAPEQALGRSREVDARTDIYGVGATMFTLLSRKFVHEAESAHEMVVVAATTPARSLASVTIGSPPAIVDLVDHALAFERHKRWPDARSMRRAVRETYASLYGPLPAERVPGAGEPPSSPVEAAVPASSAGPGVPIRMDGFSATGPTAQVSMVRPSGPAVPASALGATRVKPVQPPAPEAMTAPPTSTLASSPRSSRRWWTLAVAASCVVLAGIGISARMSASSMSPSTSAAAPSWSAAAVTEPSPPGRTPPPEALPPGPAASAAPMPSQGAPSPCASPSVPAPPPPKANPLRSTPPVPKPRAAPLPAPAVKPNPFESR